MTISKPGNPCPECVGVGWLPDPESSSPYLSQECGTCSGTGRTPPPVVGSAKPYYDDGQCVIYHGDCREILDEIGRPDAIVTDPPFGMGQLLDSYRPGKQHREWDKFYGAGAPEWDTKAPAIVAQFPDRAEHCIIWGGQFFALPPRRGWLIWDKIVREFTSGHCELAWTTLDQPVRAFNFAHGQLATEGKLHPTQKPLALMSWSLSFLPPTVQVVVDPFMGSGTTLRAAKDRGIRCIGIEIEERYCEIAATRLAQGVLDFGGVA